MASNRIGDYLVNPFYSANEETENLGEEVTLSVSLRTGPRPNRLFLLYCATSALSEPPPPGHLFLPLLLIM